MNESVLVDTSIWVDHFRESNVLLVELLDEERVLIHPFVIGELACGNIRNRHEILTLLRTLPASVVADTEEVLVFIDTRRLMGKGLGYVDIHLLASAALSNTSFWTRDRPLAAAALEMGIAFNIS